MLTRAGRHCVCARRRATAMVTTKAKQAANATTMTTAVPLTLCAAVPTSCGVALARKPNHALAALSEASSLPGPSGNCASTVPGGGDCDGELEKLGNGVGVSVLVMEHEDVGDAAGASDGDEADAVPSQAPTHPRLLCARNSPSSSSSGGISSSGMSYTAFEILSFARMGDGRNPASICFERALGNASRRPTAPSSTVSVPQQYTSSLTVKVAHVKLPLVAMVSAGNGS